MAKQCGSGTRGYTTEAAIINFTCGTVQRLSVLNSAKTRNDSFHVTSHCQIIGICRAVNAEINEGGRGAANDALRAVLMNRASRDVGLELANETSACAAAIEALNWPAQEATIKSDKPMPVVITSNDQGWVHASWRKQNHSTMPTVGTKTMAW